MSAKSLSEDPAQWARDHTYHWFWGMVRVQRRDQKTIDTWWREYSQDEAKQKELHEEVVLYRKKNFVSRFFILLFNAQNIGLKLKLYDFFKKYDLNMFANIKRDSNMMNENGVSNPTDKLETEPTWLNTLWNGLFGTNKGCVQNDTIPKDSGRNMEEKHADEVPSTIEVWPPHDDAMTQYLAVPPLHFTDTELQAAQEGLVIDTEEKLSALQEWENFYQQHIKRMAETGERDEGAEQALEPSAAMGSEYYPKVISKQGRQMGLTFHPDKGGATEDSQRINELKEFLTQEPFKNPEASLSALWNVACQCRTKVNGYAKQRFENWHAATKRYIEASWSDSEDSPDTREELKRAYYAGCEAAFRHYRAHREQAYRELMSQYAIQKAKYEENHPVAGGYAEVIARRERLEREWRLEDLELYREGCQTFLEPVVSGLQKKKGSWLGEKERLESQFEYLKKEKAELEQKSTQLRQRGLQLDGDEAVLRDQSQVLDAKDYERRKGYLVADQEAHVFDQEHYQFLLELHESSKASYEKSYARHQEENESTPNDFFSLWQGLCCLKSIDFIGAYSPMSLAFWERERTECSQAIVYLVDLKKAYPADVSSHAAPKPPLPIMSYLMLYQLNKQAAHPTSDSEPEDKKEESEAALNGVTDELSSMKPLAAGDSLEVRRIQKGFNTYPTRITSLFTSTVSSLWVFRKNNESSTKADSLPVENPTVPKAAPLTPGYDNVTGRDNHQEQKSTEPPTNAKSSSGLSSKKKL